MSPTDKAVITQSALEMREDQRGFSSERQLTRGQISYDTSAAVIDGELLRDSIAAVERAAVLVNQAVVAGDDLTVTRYDLILRAAERLLALVQHGV